MDLKEKDNLNGQPERNWYYNAKFLAIQMMIRQYAFQTVIDVGAGSGVFSKFLLRSNQAKRAICIDKNYKWDATEQVGQGELYYLRELEWPIDDTDMPVLVLLTDVLEHVRDDYQFLCWYINRIPSGSKVLLTVPAFEWLWSEHDDFLMHYRRYTLHQIEILGRRCSLMPLYGRYFYIFIFPIVMGYRCIKRGRNVKKDSLESDLKPIPKFLNDVLIFAHKLEAAAILRINRLFGVTAIALFRKP